MNSIKNIFSRSITLNYALVFLFLTIIISASLYSINTRNQDLQQIIDKQFTVNSIMIELTDLSNSRREIMRLILNDNDPFSRDTLIQKYNHLASEFIKRREKINMLNLSKVQTDIFNKSVKIVAAAYIYQTKTINLVYESDMLKAKKIFVEKILPLKSSIRDANDELIHSMYHQSKIEIDNAQRTNRNAIVIFVALIGLIFILAICVQFIATKKLKLAKDEADRANKAKSEFLTGMSHELRTPMNAILGFGQLLNFEKESLTENQNSNVNEITSAGNHLLTIINELLDLSAVEAGHMKIHIADVLLSDVLTQSISYITPQADKHQIKIINHISDKNYVVQADHTRLNQVILNLLSNAVKYGNDSSQIILYSEIVENNLRIRVTDTGEGLAKEEIAKLFTSFGRLDTTSNIEGTGLGLVITKHMIELMDGCIGVESTLGEGSTFWVEIPLSKIK